MSLHKKYVLKVVSQHVDCNTSWILGPHTHSTLDDPSKFEGLMSLKRAGQNCEGILVWFFAANRDQHFLCEANISSWKCLPTTK